MKPQKALHLYKEEEKKKPKHLGIEYWSFIKYDGWYGYYEEGKIYSRAGREIPSCVELAKKIQANQSSTFSSRVVFEIMVSGHETDFATTNGILNRKAIAQGVYIRVHDLLHFTGGIFINAPFLIRYAEARQFTKQVNLPEVKLAMIHYKSTNIDDHKRVCEDMWADGHEGIILKAAHELYCPDKRNYTLMKIKEEVTAELVVVGMEKGEGKYSNTLGALRCRSKDGTTHLISGMTDKQRDDWWTQKEMIIGEVVEIKAMKLLPDGHYREPRFKAVRHDKLQHEID
jgi:ATP-dependent DNA ligase